ncbi:MAG: hypothetical protein NT133_03625 [Alphaproteobacteria bacterium]|nr:hypothetical protein [Alphaproteobacteria bacterium]
MSFSATPSDPTVVFGPDRQYIDIAQILSYRFDAAREVRAIWGLPSDDTTSGIGTPADIVTFLDGQPTDQHRRDRIRDALEQMRLKKQIHPAWILHADFDDEPLTEHLVATRLARLGRVPDGDGYWLEMQYRAGTLGSGTDVFVPTVLDRGTVGIFHRAPAPHPTDVNSGFTLDLRPDSERDRTLPLREWIMDDNGARWLRAWTDGNEKFQKVRRTEVTALCSTDLSAQRRFHVARLAAKGYTVPL